MTYRNALMSILILASACGSDVQTTTETQTSTPTTASGTGGPTTSEGVTSTQGLTVDATSMAPTSTTTTTTTMEEGGPVFLSLNTNVSKITEGGSLTFTALLTDPDGVEDIIGGSLLSEDEMIDYGAFVSAGQPGTYSFSLSWMQIQQAVPIDFNDTDLPLTFRARFFDQEGHEAVKEAEIVLFCDGGSSCDGACTNLDMDGANCGTCGHTCASMDCKDGGCAPSWSMCFAAADGFSTCTEICQSISNECAEAQCGSGGTVQYYVDMIDCMSSSGALPSAEPCGNVQTWLSPAIRCCCTDSN